MQFGRLKRREFITLVGGAAAAWPLAGHAQQGERMRRVGVLMPAAADDADFQDRVGAFVQALALSGWAIGRDVRIDTRWAGGKADGIRRHAAELAALAPDVILAHGTSTLAPLLQETRTVPIVFTALSDPVGCRLRRQPVAAGRQRHRVYVFEFSLSGKWLELLKQIAPDVTRVAVLRDPAISAGIGLFCRHPIRGAVA